MIKTTRFGWLIGLLAAASLTVAGCDSGKKGTAEKKEAPKAETSFLKFTGGPSGGTFQYFSNGMSVRLSKKLEGVKVSNQASNGSTENLRKVNGAKADFGIVYSGDLYLGRNGRLTGDTNKYENVYAVSFLYKAPAQLAVLKDSGITTVEQLEGKRVGLGGPGSGAAASAERFFSTTGMWDKIDRQFLGYTKAAAAIKDGHLDAMWILAGYPTRALIELAATKEIILLDVGEAGMKYGLDKSHPFYQPLQIPANTYDGVTTETGSFFDSALWVAGKHTPAKYVYSALKDIYSQEGLEYLINVKSTAKQMSVAGGVTGIVTPLHPGAAKFWTEKGITISADAAAVE